MAAKRTTSDPRRTWCECCERQCDIDKMLMLADGWFCPDCAPAAEAREAEEAEARDWEQEMDYRASCW